jgi:hypothetical protein
MAHLYRSYREKMRLFNSGQAGRWGSIGSGNSPMPRIGHEKGRLRERAALANPGEEQPQFRRFVKNLGNAGKFWWPASI